MESQTLLQQYQLSKKKKVLKDIFNMRRIALSILSITMSNVITTPAYIALLVVDGSLLFYHIAVMIHSLIFKVNVQQTWTIEAYLSNIQLDSFLYIQIGILVVYFFLILTIISLCFKIDGITKVKNSTIFLKIISTLITLVQTVFSLPMLNLILRTYFNGVGSSSFGLYAATQCVNTLNALFYVIIQIILKRTAILKVPAQMLPWSEVDHNSALGIFLMKCSFVVAEVILCSFPDIQKNIEIISIILLLITLSACIYKLIVTPVYNRLITYTINIINWGTLGCAICIVFNSFKENPKEISVYYLAIIVPGMIFLYFILKVHWQQRILDKSRKINITMEMQYHYLLYLLQEKLLSWRKRNSFNINNDLKYLFGLAEDHSLYCIQSTCCCHHLESLIWISNQRENETQQFVELTNDEIQFINTWSDDGPLFHFNQLNANFTYNSFTNQKYLKLDMQEQSDREDSDIISNVIDIKASDEVTVKKSEVYQIELMKLYQTFFSRIIRHFFDQGIKRFPESPIIKLQYAYFALNHQKNIYQCINILKDIRNQKQGYFESLNSRVNEYFLCMEVEKVIEKQELFENGYNIRKMGIINGEKIQEGYLSHMQVDHEKLIAYSNLQEKFQVTIHTLSNFIYNFWKSIFDIDCNVQQVINISMSYAELISQTHYIFEQMDECYNKNEHIYYQFAFVHKELLNDKSSYELYIQKYKHIISMKKLLNEDMRQNSLVELGVILVSAATNNQGKVLECNQQMKKMTGYNTQDLKFASYEIFMNNLVKKWHNTFVTKFQSEGLSEKINKKRVNQFLLKKDGYIMPAQMSIKYQYNSSYGYCYIGLFKQIKEIELDCQMIPVEQLIFLLCDNIQGRIYDVCRNGQKILKIKKEYIKDGQQVFDQDLRISDIIPSVDICRLNELQFQKQLTNCKQFQGDCLIDLFAVKEKQKHMVQKQFIRRELASAKFKLFKEGYQYNTYEMNIVLLQIQNQITQPIRISYATNTGPMTLQNINIEETIQQDDNGMGKQEDVIMDQDGSAFSHSSASSTSSKINELIKFQQISMKKTIPRALKIVMQMILLMFLTMIVISIINLNLTKSKQDKLIREMKIAMNAYQKMFYGTRARMNARLLISMANGYEPITSNIIPNKLTFIQSSMYSSLDSYIRIQQSLENADFEYSSDFLKILKADYIPLQYLNNTGGIYIQKHSMSYMINTYVSKTLDLVNMDLSRLKGRLNLQTLTPAKLPFKATEDEKIIFYSSENGNNAMRFYNEDQTNRYVADLKQNSSGNIYFIMVTMLVCLSTILLVFLIVTPIIAMISDRQYTAAMFFFNLPKEKVMDLINKSKRFIEVFDQVYNINTISEPPSGIQQMQTLNQNQTERSAQYRTTPLDASAFSNQSLMNVTFTNNQTDFDSIAVTNPINNSRFTEGQTQNTMQDQSFANPNMVQIDEVDNEDNDKSEAEHQNLEFQFQYINENSQHLSSLKKKKVQTKEEDENQNQLQEESFRRLNKAKVQRRWRLVIVNSIALCLFSLYFIAAFLLAQNMYAQVNYIIDNISTVTFKDICLENVMIYVRENYVQNASFLLPSGAVASSTVLNRCSGFENTYRQLRKAKHPAFAQAANYMEQIEGDDLCHVVYEDDPDKKQHCNKAYNGVLQKGLSDTIAIFLSYFHKVNLKFLSTNNRPYDWLIEALQDPNAIAMIEIKIYLLDPLLITLKQKVTGSIEYYFSSQMNSFVILFACFMTILVITLIIVFGVVFMKLRDFVWKVNLTLKILPIDYLNKEQIDDFKKFLNQ